MSYIQINHDIFFPSLFKRWRIGGKVGYKENWSKVSCKVQWSVAQEASAVHQLVTKTLHHYTPSVLIVVVWTFSLKSWELSVFLCSEVRSTSEYDLYFTASCITLNYFLSVFNKGGVWYTVFSSFQVFSTLTTESVMNNACTNIRIHYTERRWLL